jgi:hypothetical protein
MTEGLYNEIVLCTVVWQGINLSPHQPVILTLRARCAARGEVSEDREEPSKKHAWCRANKEQIRHYNPDIQLGSINVPLELINCDSKNCSDLSHMQQIDTLCEEILNCCILASDKCIPQVKKKKIIPKWNEVAKPARETALFWHSIWLICGKPMNGVVCNIRRRTRDIYHRAVKELKINQTVNTSEKMAQAILKDNNSDFWRETKKFKCNKKMTPDTMDGVQENKNISEHLASKYEKLYNSVPYDRVIMEGIRAELAKRLNENEEDYVEVTPDRGPPRPYNSIVVSNMQFCY